MTAGKKVAGAGQEPADRSPRAAAALHDYLHGEAPDGAALTRLILTAKGPDELRTLVEGTQAAGKASQRLDALSGLLRRHPDAWRLVHAASATVDHRSRNGPSAATLARLAAEFDAAARISPAASVALHSLGDEGRLAAITEEVVGWLLERDVIGTGRDVLDIGCGIGRFELALAGRVRRIVGIDISAGMIAEARRRCAGLVNVELRQVAGSDLSAFAENSFDCVLAVDSFPYLVLAGAEVVERHVRDIARLLRPDGDAVILNHSYRGSFADDRRELFGLAKAAGLVPVLADPRPFRLWDGAAFHLAAPA